MALRGSDSIMASVHKDAGSVVTVAGMDNSDLPNKSKNKASGVALIKPEFVVENHQRKVEEKYLPPAVVMEIKKLTSENEAKRGSEETGTVGETPQKKAKLRGRNKKRPHDRRPQDKDKLCPSVIAATECSYGNRCKFTHDVIEYVKQRPAAHSDRCYLYETFGKCPYGVSCLCAEVHTGENYTQLVNEDLWAKCSGQVYTTNKLAHATLMSLCKKKYNFEVATKVVTAVSGGKTIERQRVERPSHYTTQKQGVSQVMVTQSSGKLLEAAQQQSELGMPGKSRGLEGTQSEPDVIHNGQVPCEEHIENVSGERNMQCNEVSIISVKNSNSEITLEECNQDNNRDISIGASSNHETSTVMQSSHNVAMLTGSGVENERKVCVEQSVLDRLGSVETEEGVIRTRPEEVKKLDFCDKLYLAPLTTVGNLPFRRICKSLGADITCSEMATATGLLQGHKSEWALLKRHHTEDVFGAQVCGSNVEVMTRCAQVLMENTDVDFIDINCGCPIELFFRKGEGCALMGKSTRLQNVVRGMTAVMDVPLTVKMRTGIFENKNIADRVIPTLRDLDVAMMTVHGRSREQRYTRSADWDYIQKCAELAAPVPLFGNGDILSYEEYNLRKQTAGVAGCLIARGALMKPWIFTEIKEQRHWDISSGERLDLLRGFCHHGLEHWGSDQKGVQTTRRFLLEWLSFLYRYIPVGVLEQVPQKINQKPPYYVGRNDLETLMASPNCADWIKISEMLLGAVPEGFQFLPKHKANSYQ